MTVTLMTADVLENGIPHHVNLLRVAFPSKATLYLRLDPEQTCRLFRQLVPLEESHGDVKACLWRFALEMLGYTFHQ